MVVNGVGGGGGVEDIVVILNGDGCCNFVILGVYAYDTEWLMLLCVAFRRQCNWPLLCWSYFFRVFIGIVVFSIVIELTVCDGSNNLGNRLRVANVIVIIRLCVISSDLAKILPPKKFIDQ